METATQALHRLTSYEPGREWTDPVDDPRVLQDLEVNDLATLPWFHKRYPPHLPRVPLPRELPTTTARALDVLAGAPVAAGRLDLRQLSRLLHLTAGVTRTTERPYGTYLFRAAGSAGGRFPLEVYVAVPSGGELPAGVHWYDPSAHALVTVGPPPRSGVPTVVVTGVPWRTAWRYRERGYRHVYWDAGTALSQLLAASASAGVTAVLRSRFPDAAVTELVGADGVHEWPVAVVSLGAAEPAVEAAGSAVAGEVDAAPRELPLVTAAQRAGDGSGLGEGWPEGAPVQVAAVGGTVEEVVLRRGSQRRMDPSRTLAVEALRSAVAVAMRGIDVEHLVVVHGVDGVEPGVYRWPHLETAVRAGDLRQEAYVVALEQGLARDAAFVAVGVTEVARLDDRGYREAQLAAGLVEGRLHLAAYALGASASGMTFLDSELPALVGADVDGLLWTCVGVPDYASAPGGLPGAPTEVRQVAPRE